MAGLRRSFLRVMGGLVVVCATTDFVFFRNLPSAIFGTLVAAQAGVLAPLVPLGLHYLPLVRNFEGKLYERWVLPNVLTAARIFAIPSIVIGLQHLEDTRARLGVTVLVLVASASDLLDGFISRRFARESELGRALDPFADTCFYTAVSAGLFAAKHLPAWFLIVALGRFVPSFVVGFTLFLRGGKLEISPTTLGKLSSAGVGVTILAFLASALRIPIPPLALHALGGVVTALCIASAVQYGQLAWQKRATTGGSA
jgi:cardiolipin synthase